MQNSPWQAWDSYEGNPVPAQRLKDLLDMGSLTQRLTKASHGDFQVKVLEQGWQIPELSEQTILGLDPSELALVREVQLVCKGQVWVVARSIIPKKAVSGDYRFLAELGDKPLGEVLFKDPSLKRTSFEICEIKDEQWSTFDQIANTLAVNTVAWGRRSVFTLGGNPILVAEIFLDACPVLHDCP